MKNLRSVLLFWFASLGASFAQTEPSLPPTTPAIVVQRDTCDCRCRDVVYHDCSHKRFTSLRVDTVAGRIGFITNLGFQPFALHQKHGLSNSTTHHVPTFLTWDFIDADVALIRGLYWGWQVGMSVPVGSSFKDTQNAEFDVRFRPSFNMGTGFSLDLLRAKKFKIFASTNLQFSFNHLNLRRTETTPSQLNWLTFMRQNAGNSFISYQDLLQGMKTTQRDRLNIHQFTMQFQAGLGMDILLNPNGWALRLQAGYQLPIETNSAWRYSYGADTVRNEGKGFKFRIQNSPFRTIQNGVYAKISFNWLINKGQDCVKRVRKECCDDYRYSNSNNNNNNNNREREIIINRPNNPTPRNPTPRNPTPRNPTPRTPTPKPIPR